jgi:DNA-directed RNA polymerase subunit beta'
LKESRGEVLKPETINYRTHKPERDGSFCERILDLLDFECACGKYKRIVTIICTVVVLKLLRKKYVESRSHQSCCANAHIWYFRSLPNKIGYILGLPSKKLDMIIYYER